VVKSSVTCWAFWGVLGAKVINAHHSIVNEVRTHLKHHDAGPLVGDFPLLAHILVNLVIYNNGKHGKCGENHANEDYHWNKEEGVGNKGSRHRQQMGKKGPIVFFWQAVAPLDYTGQIKNQQNDHASQ